MARSPNKHGRDQAQGFLNDLQDWELSLKDKDKKMKHQQYGPMSDFSTANSEKEQVLLFSSHHQAYCLIRAILILLLLLYSSLTAVFLPSLTGEWIFQAEEVQWGHRLLL